MAIVTIHTFILLVLLYALGIYLYKEVIKLLEIKILKTKVSVLQRALICAIINTPIFTGVGGGHGAILYVVPSFIGVPYLFLIFEGQVSLIEKLVIVSVLFIITYSIIYAVLKLKGSNAID